MGNPYYGKGLYSRWLEELAACRQDPELVILETVRRKGWDIGWLTLRSDSQDLWIGDVSA